MTTSSFNFDHVDPTWKNHIKKALLEVDNHYLQSLLECTTCLPHKSKIFNAFSLPLTKLNYLLIGESPYPREHSANGYAFWDASVGDLWSETGLSKRVNRATSLRNIIKMLLIAEDVLDKENPSQENIAQISKTPFVKTNEELFHNFLAKGFLLLNASLVLRPQAKIKDAKAWYPFLKYILLNCILSERPDAKLILFGQIANPITHLVANHPIKKLIAEHPYNLSFCFNPNVIQFFKPLHLLRKNP